MSKTAKADGIQVVGNHGQIVSTGNVTVSQAAGGVQTVYGEGGQVLGTQAVDNDLQIVATGNVTTTQAASGQQSVGGPYSNGGSCQPGDYYEEAGCVYFCSTDGCTWLSHCCDICGKCPKPKGKCCK